MQKCDRKNILVITPDQNYSDSLVSQNVTWATIELPIFMIFLFPCITKHGDMETKRSITYRDHKEIWWNLNSAWCQSPLGSQYLLSIVITFLLTFYMDSLLIMEIITDASFL
jgi:hypothetical protein